MSREKYNLIVTRSYGVRNGGNSGNNEQLIAENAYSVNNTIKFLQSEKIIQIYSYIHTHIYIYIHNYKYTVIIQWGRRRFQFIN